MTIGELQFILSQYPVEMEVEMGIPSLMANTIWIIVAVAYYVKEGEEKLILLNSIPEGMNVNEIEIGLNVKTETIQ